MTQPPTNQPSELRYKLDEILDNAGCKEDFPDFKNPNLIYSPREAAKSALLTLLSTSQREAELEKAKKAYWLLTHGTPEEAKSILRADIKRLKDGLND